MATQESGQVGARGPTNAVFAPLKGRVAICLNVRPVIHTVAAHPPRVCLGTGRESHFCSKRDFTHHTSPCNCIRACVFPECVWKHEAAL